MSLVPINVVWTRIYENPSGGLYTGNGQWFDTDTRQIVTASQNRSRATLDPYPIDVHLVAGDYIWETCEANFLHLEWRYNGSGGFTIIQEADSPACGYVPPATCKLGTLTVTQTPTPTGATLLALFSGTCNGTAYYSLDGGAEQPSPQFLGVSFGQPAASAWLTWR
jgi:hypothetical protein